MAEEPVVATTAYGTEPSCSPQTSAAMRHCSPVPACCSKSRPSHRACQGPSGQVGNRAGSDRPPFSPSQGAEVQPKTSVSPNAVNGVWRSEGVGIELPPARDWRNASTAGQSVAFQTSFQTVESSVFEATA